MMKSHSFRLAAVALSLLCATQAHADEKTFGLSVLGAVLQKVTEQAAQEAGNAAGAAAADAVNGAASAAGASNAGSGGKGWKINPNATLREPDGNSMTRGEHDGMKAMWQKMITSQHVGTIYPDRKFTLLYVYPSFRWEEVRRKAHVNGSYVETIAARNRLIQSVFQDQDGNYWSNRFFLVENAPPGSYFGERWRGDYEWLIASTSIPVAMTKENALKYQNAVKVR